jgi:hypothetical protein
MEIHKRVLGIETLLFKVKELRWGISKVRYEVSLRGHSPTLTGVKEWPWTSQSLSLISVPAEHWRPFAGWLSLRPLYIIYL